MKRSVETLSSVRAFASGVLWNGCGRVLPILIALAATPFLLHALGVERWALFSIASSVAGSFGVLDFGISAALSRALAERIGTEEERDAPSLIVAALGILTLIGVVAGAVAFVATPYVIDHLLSVPATLHRESVLSFRLLAIAAPLIVMNSVFWGVLSAYQSWRAGTLLGIPISAMYYLGPLLALQFRSSLVWVIIAFVVTRVLQTTVNGILTLRLLPELKLCRRIDVRLLRPLLRVSVWVAMSSITSLLTLFLDRFVVGSTLSLKAVSYFATPTDVVMRLALIPAATAAALFPAVATSHRSMPEAVRRILSSGSLVVVAVLFPACLLIAGLSKELLTLWLDAAFAAQSANVLMILAIGMVPFSIAVLPGTLTEAIGRPEVGAIAILVITVLFLPVFVVTSARHGVTGAALAWTARSYLFCLARLWICSRLSRITAPVALRLAVWTTISTGAMAFCPFIPVMSERLLAIGAVTAVMLLAAVAGLLSHQDRVALRHYLQAYTLVLKSHTSRARFPRHKPDHGRA